MYQWHFFSHCNSPHCACTLLTNYLPRHPSTPCLSLRFCCCTPHTLALVFTLQKTPETKCSRRLLINYVQFSLLQCQARGCTLIP